MSNHLYPVGLQHFAAYAVSDSELWRQATGALVCHKNFSEGTLRCIEDGLPSPKFIIVEIEFPEFGFRKFNLSQMLWGSDFTTIRLPGECAGLLEEINAWIVQSQEEARIRAEHEERLRQDQMARGRELRKRREEERRVEEQSRLAVLRRQEAQQLAKELRNIEEQRVWDEKRIKERERRRQEQLKADEELRDRKVQWETITGRSWDDASYHFWQLAYLYDLPITMFDPDDDVLEVLLRLDRGDELKDQDLELLTSRGAPELADRLHEIRVQELRYRAQRQPGILARISRLWREIGRPELALEATGRVIGSEFVSVYPIPSNTEAMLLTTRGGSFRDLRQLAQARSCAERAILLRPNDGFAYCLLGAIDVEDGCLANGEDNFDICESYKSIQEADVWKKGAMQNTKNKAEYAAFLLDRDPERYSWAWKFLN